jgi:murein DD-endopeptidase MepM/ murein hydrolase activator NlpD
MKSGVLTIIFFYLLSLCPVFSMGNFTEPVIKGKITEPKTDTDPKVAKPKSNEDEDEDEDEEDHDEEAVSDTLFYKNLSSVIWDVNDSLVRIPAYDVYCDWNNYVIHPYRFDLSQKKDTTIIKLQDHYCDYAHPVEGHITSNFGPRKGRFHYGIDLKLQTGDSVFNAFDGVVRISRYSPSYGNVVVVRHSNGLETLYAHLDKLGAEVGSHVNAGDFIGLGGNTGRSSGSHLHFEVRYKGEAINPADIICFENYILKKDVLAITPKLFTPVIQAKAAKYHVVKSGDTLGKISKKYRVPISTLCKLNGIKTTTVLRLGKKLRYA